MRKKLLNLQENTVHLNNGFILTFMKHYQEEKQIEIHRIQDMTIKLRFMEEKFKKNSKKLICLWSELELLGASLSRLSL